MSRRRISHAEEESSLELLLDTMCNTFGGVMFIAISLFILIILQRAMERPATEQSNVMQPVAYTTPEALHEELMTLQKLLESRQQELKQLEEKIKHEQDSQVQQQRREVVLLRTLQKELELRQKNLMLQLQAQDSTLLELDKASEKLLLEQQKIQEELEKAQLQKEFLKQEEAALQQKKAFNLTLDFKVMEQSAKMPFYIILHQDRAWAVGPWRDTNQQDKPDDAVTSSIHKEGDLVFVNCQIKQDQGISVLSNGALSAEFTALLNRIPYDRTPKFFIHPDAAKSAYTMREQLKAKAIVHGCSLAESDSVDFQYIYTQENVRYEY